MPTSSRYTHGSGPLEGAPSKSQVVKCCEVGEVVTAKMNFSLLSLFRGFGLLSLGCDQDPLEAWADEVKVEVSPAITR